MNIYGIENDKDNTIEKIQSIANQIDEELGKEDNEIDKKVILKLRYQQFIQGLKLSTGIKHY